MHLCVPSGRRAGRINEAEGAGKESRGSKVSPISHAIPLTEVRHHTSRGARQALQVTYH